MKIIYLAGGCFWGVEKYFQNLKGVEGTAVGYANSEKKYPTYEEVCTGKTFAAEAVKVEFDESIISFEKLLEHFFNLIDPTLLNRQGNDIGSQYRTGVYYLSENSRDAEIIEGAKNRTQKDYKEKIVTEIKKLENFYLAEEYHQNYLLKNPKGYCHCNLEIEKLLASNESK